MCLGQCWCQPASSLVSLLNLCCLLLLLCCAVRYAHLFPLLSPLAFSWRCDFAAWEGHSPVGCWAFYSLEWARWSVKVLAGLQNRNVAFAQFLRSHACFFFFSPPCSARTPMPTLGHKPCYSLGVSLVTSHAPTTPFSATATLATNLILISSLLCFRQPKFPTQAWEFNISTFAWLIRFVSLLWRHCFYGKLMDSHVVFLIAETSHPWALRGEVCKQLKLAILHK